jgi:hypothetical protein
MANAFHEKMLNSTLNSQLALTQSQLRALAAQLEALRNSCPRFEIPISDKRSTANCGPHDEPPTVDLSRILTDVQLHDTCRRGHWSLGGYCCVVGAMASCRNKRAIEFF